MFISVEGIDRAGKDSFLLSFDKKNKWHNCDMMRGPAGCYFYDKFYNRETTLRREEAFQVAQAIKKVDHLILFFYADREDILKRLEEEGKTEKEQFEHLTIEEAIEGYRKCLYELYDPDEVLEINTSHYTVDQEVNLVETTLQSIRSMDMQLIEMPSAHIISPNEGEFKYTQYRPFSRVYTKYSLDMKDFDISVDAPYYNMLFYSLKHKLYERDLGWLNDRQIVYTSNDCISMIQIYKEGENVRYVVHQRSMDVEKHKMNDILFFKWFHNHVFQNDNYIIDYTCQYPHRYINY